MPELNLDLSSLGQDNRPDPDEVFDILIIGGGPAAMAAAVYAARKMLKVALVARDFSGQTGSTSEVENYLGFQTIRGLELADRFVEHVKQFNVPMEQGQKVVEVRKEGDTFKSVLEDGRGLASRVVIVATGKRSRPLGVPGEKELVGRGVAYCATCDAPFFRDRRVVVAGGGNSALTAAQDLLKVATEVTVVNFAPGWQADAVLMTSVRKHDYVSLLDNTAIVRIEGEGKVTGVAVKDRATGEERLIQTDGVFVEIGLLPNTGLVKNLAELNEEGELVVDCRCRTSVAGLFGAGDVTTVPYKQIVISAGEGAKAALSAYDYLSAKGLV
jgi:alkyl hydroperoxide reductase subunit F